MAQDAKKPINPNKYCFVLHTFSKEASEVNTPTTDTDALPLHKQAYKAVFGQIYDSADGPLTTTRVHFQKRSDFIGAEDHVTNFSGENPAVIPSIIGALMVAGFALHEAENIAQERNIDFRKMFGALKEELLEIEKINAGAKEKERQKEDRIKTYNKALQAILSREEFENKFKKFEVELNDKGVLALIIESNSLDATYTPTPSSRWEKIKNYLEFTWDTLYIPPLIFWILWGGATLVTGGVSELIPGGFVLSAILGFGIPMAFLAIHLTFAAFNYLRDKVQLKTFHAYDRFFFNRTKLSQSDNIAERVFSGLVVNPLRYLFGTVFAIPYFIFFILPEKVFGSKQPKVAPEVPDNAVDLCSPLADEIRKAIKALHVVKQYPHPKNLDIPVDQKAIPVIELAETKNKAQPKSEYSKLYLTFFALKNLFGLVIGMFFIGWFIIASAAVFGAPISLGILAGLGIGMLAASGIIAAVRTYEFREKLINTPEVKIAALEEKIAALKAKITLIASSEEYSDLEEFNNTVKDLQNLKKDLEDLQRYQDKQKAYAEQEEKLSALKAQFKNWLATLDRTQASKLRQAAEALPDHKKSGIFKDVENTKNDDPTRSKISLGVKLFIALGTGALITRFIGVEGTANGLLPYFAGTSSNFALFGASAVTGGWLLWGLVAVMAVLYATFVLLNHRYEAQQALKNPSELELDARQLALDNEIGFYEHVFEKSRPKIAAEETPKDKPEAKYEEDATENNKLDEKSSSSPITASASFFSAKYIHFPSNDEVNTEKESEKHAPPSTHH